MQANDKDVDISPSLVNGTAMCGVVESPTREYDSTWLRSAGPYHSQALLQMSMIQTPGSAIQTMSGTYDHAHNPFTIQYMAEKEARAPVALLVSSVADDAPAVSPRASMAEASDQESPPASPCALASPDASSRIEHVAGADVSVSSRASSSEDVHFLMNPAQAASTEPACTTAKRAVKESVSISFNEFHCGSCGVLNLLQPGYSMAKCGQCGQLVVLVEPEGAAPPRSGAPPLSARGLRPPCIAEEEEEAGPCHARASSEAGASDGGVRPGVELPCMQGWLAKKGGSRGMWQGIDSAVSKVMTGSGRRNWRKRYFVTHWLTRKLLYYRDERDYTPIGSVDLLYCSVRREAHNKMNHCFSIDSKGRGTMLLSAPSLEEMEAWISCLEKSSAPDDEQQ